MLDKNTNKIRKILIHHKFEKLSLDEIINLSKLDEKVVKTSLEYLIELNCVKYTHFRDMINNYEITFYGKKYYHKIISEWIKSVLNGIIFPILVALITTLLTIYLSPIQQNKQGVEIQCNCKNDTVTNP